MTPTEAKELLAILRRLAPCVYCAGTGTRWSVPEWDGPSISAPCALCEQTGVGDYETRPWTKRLIGWADDASAARLAEAEKAISDATYALHAIMFWCFAPELGTAHGLARAVKHVREEFRKITDRAITTDMRLAEVAKEQDVLSARVRELEADLAVMAHAYRHDTRPPDDVVQRAARALKGEG